MEDVVIIGGGIIGCSIAYELSHYQLQVTLVEKNQDVADEVTMANSAIVHAGYDPEDGTLKAQCNVTGARLMKQWCEELMVDYVACGAFVVACSDEEEITLKQLYNRAIKRHIKASLLTRDAALQLEPHLSERVRLVMDVPQTAIITPWNMAIGAMETAMENGTKLLLNSPVTSIEKQADYFLVKAGNQSIQTRYVINAAGLYSDVIDEMATGIKHFHIQARKGEYFVLSKDVKDFVSRVIYPTPSKTGKGVLAVPTVHGNVLIGPNRVDTAVDDHGCDTQGLSFVKHQIQHTLSNVPLTESIRTFSGLRPAGNHGDFYIKEEMDKPGFMNVGCIDSPGIASAPGIAQFVRQIIADKMELKVRTNYQKRRAPVVMAKLSRDDLQALISRDPRYGYMVCRCEKISEGEIIDAIMRPCGATTIKGVKKRVRPGMGRCQGGFCEPLVSAILAKTLQMNPLDICYDQQQTKMFVSHTKEEIL